MIKNVLSVVTGLVVGFALIYVIEMLSHIIYPFPATLDPTDMEAMAEYSRNLPSGAFWFVILAYAVGSFFAGMVSSLIAKTSKIRMAMIVGVILLVAGLINLLMFPHPVWFWVVSLAVFMPACWIGASLVIKKDPPGTTAPGQEA